MLVVPVGRRFERWMYRLERLVRWGKVISDLLLVREGETCKSSRSASVNSVRFSEEMADSISNAIAISKMRSYDECYTIFRKRYVDMFPLGQARCISFQKVCVLHDRINLDMCFKGYRERRSPFALEASIGDK